ncbi:hypothetical protein ACWESE_36385, partial [Streptomyces xanthochromogenes]
LHTQRIRRAQELLETTVDTIAAATGMGTTASRTRTPVSSTTCSTRVPTSCACTCRRTPTHCSRWPTTSCAPATM